jgi:hypothetical protein
MAAVPYRGVRIALVSGPDDERGRGGGFGPAISQHNFVPSENGCTDARGRGQLFGPRRGEVGDPLSDLHWSSERRQAPGLMPASWVKTRVR